MMQEEALTSLTYMTAQIRLMNNNLRQKVGDA